MSRVNDGVAGTWSTAQSLVDRHLEDLVEEGHDRIGPGEIAGVARTQAGSACTTLPSPRVIVAVTGPSATSSCQFGLL